MMKSYKMKKGTFIKIKKHTYSPAFGYCTAYWYDSEMLKTTLDEDVVVSCSERGKEPIEDRATDKLVCALLKKYKMPAIRGEHAYYTICAGTDEEHLAKFRKLWEEVK